MNTEKIKGIDDETSSGSEDMPVYRHYADYLVKKAMNDPGSVDDFLRHTIFTDSLWQEKVIGLRKKDIRGFRGRGSLQRDDLNKAIKRETLDGGLVFNNARIIIEGEASLAVEDIYQLLRQEAAALAPEEERLPLVGAIISLADSPIHRINKKPWPFLEITDILGPRTSISFASINLYLIEADFYEGYFRNLWQHWSQAEAKRILDKSFSSLLLSYWTRRLWLNQDTVQGVRDRLDALKGFLDTIWDKTRYGRIFYETMKLFKGFSKLIRFFDERGLKMKSFADTMPAPTRKIYEEVLVAPVVKRLTHEYGEKLKQGELEKEKAEKEREKIEAELERERAEKEKERIEAELEKERIEARLERERVEKERIEAEMARERAEKEIRATCQQVILNKFPDVSGSALVAVNQLSFSQCNQLLRGLERVRDVRDCETFLKSL